MMVSCVIFFSFFFQAEDGIRDADVTGVQTCALPICGEPETVIGAGVILIADTDQGLLQQGDDGGENFFPFKTGTGKVPRSEERRVGKEWRAGWSRDQKSEVRRGRSVDRETETL